MTEINVCWQRYWIHILSKNWSLTSAKCWHGYLERWTIKCRIHPPSLICCAECSASWYFTYQQKEPSDEVGKVFWVEKNTLKWISALCQGFRHSIASHIPPGTYVLRNELVPWCTEPLNVGCVCLQLELINTMFGQLNLPPQIQCLFSCREGLWADLKVWKQGRNWKLLCWPLGGQRQSPWDQNIVIYYFLIGPNCKEHVICFYIAQQIVFVDKALVTLTLSISRAGWLENHLFCTIIHFCFALQIHPTIRSNFQIVLHFQKILSDLKWVVDC